MTSFPRVVALRSATDLTTGRELITGMVGIPPSRLRMEGSLPNEGEIGAPLKVATLEVRPWVTGATEPTLPSRERL